MLLPCVPCISGRSSKPEATNKGNWKLVPSHGDKEIMVVQKKGRTSQEVILNYRKSKDRKHQVTMLHKDCDTPLPFDVAVHDSIEGAVIDDIQVCRHAFLLLLFSLTLPFSCYPGTIGVDGWFTWFVSIR